MFRRILTLVLCASSLHFPVHATAATTQSLHAKEPIEKMIVSQEAIKLTALERTVQKYNSLNSPESFVHAFLGSYPAEDKRQALMIFRKHKVLPKISRAGMTITIHSESGPIIVDARDVDQRMFRLNGEKWILSPRDSMPLQLDLINKKLKLVEDRKKNGHAFLLLDLALPKAHAFWNLILTGGTKLFNLLLVLGVIQGTVNENGFVSNYVTDWTCPILIDYLKWDAKKICTKWSDNRASEDVKISPNDLKLLKKRLTDLAERYREFDKSKRVCPTSEKPTLTTVIQVKPKDQKEFDKKKDPTVALNITYKADGSVEKATLSDTSKPDKKPVTYNFGPKEELVDIVIDLTKAEANQGKTENETTVIGDKKILTDGSEKTLARNLTAVQRGELETLKELIVFSMIAQTDCMESDFKAAQKDSTESAPAPAGKNLPEPEGLVQKINKGSPTTGLK